MIKNTGVFSVKGKKTFDCGKFGSKKNIKDNSLGQDSIPRVNVLS